MLQRIREGVGRWVAGIILGLIAIAFIFWGVDPTIMGTTFAARVNGEEVGLADFERALQVQQRQYQELYRTEITDDLQRELRLSVLESLVRTRALSQRAESEGYRISDERLIAALQTRPEYQIGGEFSLDLLRSRLLTQGVSETFFLEQQREQLALLELQNGITTSAFYTPAELARYIALYHQERELGYALFEADGFRDGIELDEAQVLTYFEDNRARFFSEESVDLEYIEILRADLAAEVEVTEEILRDYYEDEQFRFQTEEERRARHILINSPDENPEAEARAADVLRRLEDGEAFEALAMEVSEDAGTAGQGGDLGWLSRGLLIGPFEDTLFAMESGAVEGPIKTDFGYHIIRLEEVRAGEVQTFEQVREELAADYQGARAEELFYNQANDLADRSFDAFDQLAGVAADMGVELRTFEGFTRTGSLSPFDDSAPVVQAAFSPEVLEQGENSGLVEISADHVLVLRVAAHHPPAEQPLAAVRADIEEELTRTAAERLADAAAAAFLERMAELPAERTAPEAPGSTAAASETVEGEPAPDGTGAAAPDDGQSESAPPAPSPLAVLASEHGGTWTPASWVERTDPVVPTEILAAAFRGRLAEAEPVRQRIPLASGDQAVVAVTGVRPGNADSLTRAERQLQVTQLSEQAATFEITSYAGEVREQASVRIPDVVLDPPLF